MRYLAAFLILIAVGACAEHHTLTECKGPYLALNPPPPPPLAEAPNLPSRAQPPAQKQQQAVNQGVLK
jgi:hypothetical protein